MHLQRVTTDLPKGPGGHTPKQGASGPGSSWRLREKPSGLSCFWRRLHFSACSLVLQPHSQKRLRLRLSVLCFCPHVFSDTEPPPPLYKDLVIRLGSIHNPGSCPLSRSCRTHTCEVPLSLIHKFWGSGREVPGSLAVLPTSSPRGQVGVNVSF